MPRPRKKYKETYQLIPGRSVIARVRRPGSGSAWSHLVAAEAKRRGISLRQAMSHPQVREKWQMMKGQIAPQPPAYQKPVVHVRPAPIIIDNEDDNDDNDEYHTPRGFDSHERMMDEPEPANLGPYLLEYEAPPPPPPPAYEPPNAFDQYDAYFGDEEPGQPAPIYIPEGKQPRRDDFMDIGDEPDFYDEPRNAQPLLLMPPAPAPVQIAPAPMDEEPVILGIEDDFHEDHEQPGADEQPLYPVILPPPVADEPVYPVIIDDDDADQPGEEDVFFDVEDPIPLAPPPPIVISDIDEVRGPEDIDVYIPPTVKSAEEKDFESWAADNGFEPNAENFEFYRSHKQLENEFKDVPIHKPKPKKQKPNKKKHGSDVVVLAKPKADYIDRVAASYPEPEEKFRDLSPAEELGIENELARLPAPPKHIPGSSWEKLRQDVEAVLQLNRDEEKQFMSWLKQQNFMPTYNHIEAAYQTYELDKQIAESKQLLKEKEQEELDERFEDADVQDEDYESPEERLQNIAEQKAKIAEYKAKQAAKKKQAKSFKLVPDRLPVDLSLMRHAEEGEDEVPLFSAAKSGLKSLSKAASAVLEDEDAEDYKHESKRKSSKRSSSAPRESVASVSAAASAARSRGDEDLDAGPDFEAYPEANIHMGKHPRAAHFKGVYGKGLGAGLMSQRAVNELLGKSSGGSVKFDKLKNKIEQEYERRGMKRKQADYVAQATAGKIANMKKRRRMH